MTARYYFHVGAMTGSPPVGMPPLVNYQARIAEHASCLGVWFFDPAYATVVSSKFTSVNNWRTTGLPLTQAVGIKQADVVVDSTLGNRSVAAFVRASAYQYTMASPVFNSGVTWSIVAVVKPDFLAAELIAGTTASVAVSRGAIYSELGGGTTPRIRTYSAGSNASINAATNTWHRAIGSVAITGSSRVAKMKVGTAAVNVAAASSANTPASTVFSVGNDLEAYGGRIACIMAFTSDLHDAANLTLFNDVNGFLDLRYGGLV